MRPHRPPPQHRCRRSRQQRGVYALEWAIIFPVFFALLYGIVCYGLTFLVRQSMQYAVEEGARAALRYPSSTIIGNNPPTWAFRSLQARRTTANALSWLPPGLRPAEGDIDFTLCHLADTACNQDTALNPALDCTVDTPCLVLVSYRIDNYRQGAIAPAIPGLGLVLPASLQAQASLLVDRRML
ncbi:Flp pilus assembly protein TadG [Comamonas sp. BIGb0152]|uniref:TadE/TadG family type IV pilus assembly protein n=1 Tax=Comamonas sp. BIGb0152 TaxID=2940601 RepID=UPI00216A9B1E|nr:TadE/TadG family type IV pilus assembly protein [Comamonas sp. BIGb0152]MCS4295461.1 Flp pilus assembly protein TadG [Comamonas sp. BIGb0152]